jgi:CDGSH-type Zn-finger protein
MYKTASLFLLFAASASAFGTAPFGVQSSRQSTAIFEGKINDSIDLDSAKVVNMEALAAGEKKVYCRCWKSGTFPLCDAAHVEHNKACGDNVGPLIVSAPKKEE